MKYEAEIRCEEVAYDANFSYGIQIRNNLENRSKLMALSFWRYWKHKIAGILGTNWSARLKFSM